MDKISINGKGQTNLFYFIYVKMEKIIKDIETGIFFPLMSALILDRSKEQSNFELVVLVPWTAQQFMDRTSRQ